jgi:hypothetical protein
LVAIVDDQDLHGFRVTRWEAREEGLDRVAEGVLAEGRDDEGKRLPRRGLSVA